MKCNFNLLDQNLATHFNFPPITFRSKPSYTVSLLTYKSSFFSIFFFNIPINLLLLTVSILFSLPFSV